MAGLTHAATTLGQRGRTTSAVSIVGDALQYADSRHLLDACLQTAEHLKSVPLIEDCIAKSEGALPGNEECAAFARRARDVRFATLAEQYLDTRTPYRNLIKHRGFTDAQCLIYADIDLNTVDGSAIWMNSTATILSRNWKTIVISKNPIRRDAVVRHLLSEKNALLITPGNSRFGSDYLNVEQCVALIREIDDFLPHLGAVFVRGMAAVEELLKTRQLYKRVYAYLTDIYTHTEDGIAIKSGSQKLVDQVARQGAGFLVQTPNIQKLIEKLAPFPPKIFDLPPPVPDGLLNHIHTGSADNVIRIGYAGKIAPHWGIQQLCQWVADLRKSGYEIELTIIGDKIFSAGDAKQNRQFRHFITTMLDKAGARRLGAMERNAVLREMEKMDFAWCWRPPEFEKHTLELSSKLVESVISGIPSIVYPSSVNVNSLGEDYPFFAESIDDFKKILKLPRPNIPAETRVGLDGRHSFSNQAAHLLQGINLDRVSAKRRMLLATHDPKFIFAYYSELKRQGSPVTVEGWEWGGLGRDTKSDIHNVDIVFCEWGLANAVWHSKNKLPHQRLVVRVHAQEVRPRAAKFGHAILAENVDCFIFVAEWVRDEAIELFGWPAEKTAVVPNFLLGDEFRFVHKDFSGRIRLGMVGIVPSMKRLDRALDLLECLEERGRQAELHIKGPLPKDLPFMLAESRADEMKEYERLFERIQKSSNLSSSVEFHPPGNDVAAFYSEVDHILSPSDSESFHYALADGVLCGCHPIIWDRSGAADLFSSAWTIPSTEAAAMKILAFRELPQSIRSLKLEANRELLISRYGTERIFSALNEITLC